MRQWILIASVSVLACATSNGQQFQAQGVDLLSHLSLTDLGVPAGGNGNDVWGYVSPSGREYAVVGLYNQSAYVEVTNPASPVVRGTIAHAGSEWDGLKVYSHYAYVVNETGGGMQVIDLNNIDSGTVTLVRSITANGLTHSHTMAMNTDSGYLYLCGSDVAGANGGLVAFSLADPSNPVQVGFWSGHYVHEAQVVSFTSGPYAGREIAYCSNEGSGMTIVDVTNKAAMTTLSTTTYPGLQYCHQAWLSQDRQYLYVNDELDGPAQGVPSTLTRIINVANINAPFLAGTFTSNASTSVDHNLYVNGRYIYESNYRSGLRVFDAINPTAPVEVAFIDTYPEDDATGYNGTWSNYPFFPSGTVAVNDIDRGLFVVRLNLNYLTFTYVGGAPTQVLPNQPHAITVQVGNVGAPLDPSSVTLYARIGGGAYTPIPMASIGGNQFRASLPGAPCDSTINYYVSARNTLNATSTSPLGAPTWYNSARAIAGTIPLFTYDMETAAGWTGGVAGDTAVTGMWERGDPQGTAAQPEDDHTAAPGVNCWATGLAAGSGVGAFDVDGGRTTLLSPVFSLAGAPAATYIGYWRWYSNNQGASPNADVFTVDLSNDGGANWVNAETVGPAGAGTGGGWYYHEFLVTSVRPMTATMRMRFIAEDAGAGSVVEAAVDDVTVFTIDCAPPCGSADFDCDGDVGTDADIESFFACLAGSCPAAPCPSNADFNGDGDVGTDADIESFFRVLGGGPC